MQQVRAEIKGPSVEQFEYLFERESQAWDQDFSDSHALKLPSDRFGPGIPTNGNLSGRSWRETAPFSSAASISHQCLPGVLGYFRRRASTAR
jgi:hypothetical protein